MIPILILSLALTAIRPIAAQSCTDVTISSQADADSAFNDCNDIRGSVTISSDAAGTLNLDGLESVTEDLIIEDTGLVGITTPDIENVGGSVSVTGNEQLNRLGLDSIANIGGDLTVQGNNALVDLRMNDLETIRGGMHLNGGFNTLSFEALETVGGESDIVATGSAGCSGIDSLNADGAEEAEGEVFQGSYTCATTSSSPSPTSSSTSSSSPASTPTDPDSDSDSGLSGGAIAGIVIGVVIGVIIILILVWLFLRERRKNRASAAAAGAGFAGAAAAIGNRRDEEKQPSQTTSPGSTSAPGTAAAALAGGAAGAGAGAAGTIPRRPVSTATALTTSSTDPSSGLPSSLTAGSTNPSTMPVPTALIPGTNGAATGGGGGGDGNPRNTIGSEHDSLFFTTPVASRPPPYRQPSERDVPMLDSEDVHEVSGVSAQREQEPRVERVVGDGAVFELDGGFNGAKHQRAIHGETPGDGNDTTKNSSNPGA
ncbi:hypothetical protein BDW62DRAFT_174747 [Aspergillus aurantiobrunneus]